MHLASIISHKACIITFKTSLKPLLNFKGPKALNFVKIDSNASKIVSSLIPYTILPSKSIGNIKIIKITFFPHESGVAENLEKLPKMDFSTLLSIDLHNLVSK